MLLDTVIASLLDGHDGDHAIQVLPGIGPGVPGLDDGAIRHLTGPWLLAAEPLAGVAQAAGSEFAALWPVWKMRPGLTSPHTATAAGLAR